MVTEGEERPAQPQVRSAAWGFVLAVLHSLRSGVRRLQRWNGGRGAKESGLARLVEVHALHAGGDATVAVALAGTLFFSAPTDQARGRLALYLLITMAPFAVVAPLLGPLLDRFQHGRRLALALAMWAGGVLALVIGHNVGSGTAHALALYPAALGVLIAGKTYGIARAAAVPRLLPDGMTLVQANSRLTIVGVITPALVGGVAVALTQLFGSLTALRLGTALYVLAGVLALRLPRFADGGAAAHTEEQAAGRGLLRLSNVETEVVRALRLAATLRWLAGFLLLYGAFVLRTHKLSGLSHNLSLGALAVGIGVGNLAGTAFAARVASGTSRRAAPPMLAVVAAASLYTAIDFGLGSVILMAVVSSAAAAMAKLRLDATIQQRVPDEVRTSTFARSETALQLAWVAGGAIGIVLPTTPIVGFLVATVVLTGGLAIVLGWSPTRTSGRSRSSSG